MILSILKIGNRMFLHICSDEQTICSIPIDRIKCFDYSVANGGASGNSVKIVTDDPNEDWVFAFDNMEDIKSFCTNLKWPES